MGVTWWWVLWHLVTEPGHVFVSNLFQICSFRIQTTGYIIPLRRIPFAKYVKLCIDHNLF